jgi:hypothetical protein
MQQLVRRLPGVVSTRVGYSGCASPRHDAARHFVSGQPLSLAVKNA